MKHRDKKECSKNPFVNHKEQDENKEVLKEEDIQNQEDTEIKAETEAEESSNATDELQKKYDVLNNQYIRLAADFDNFRKRQAQEREHLINYGAENSMKKLIEVLDNFDRAKQAIDKTDDINVVKDSFNLLYNQLFDNLSKLGLEVIDAKDKEFDPSLHEAVMQTPTNEHPENQVIAELQKGYKLGDKVLRPTLVNVATEG